MISFDHIDFWENKFQKELRTYKLNTIVYIRNLINQGDFDGIEFNTIECFICDAPPAQTIGGRSGFFIYLKIN